VERSVYSVALRLRGNNYLRRATSPRKNCLGQDVCSGAQFRGSFNACASRAARCIREEVAVGILALMPWADCLADDPDPEWLEILKAKRLADNRLAAPFSFAARGRFARIWTSRPVATRRVFRMA
jgi:hypothetical protein